MSSFIAKLRFSSNLLCFSHNFELKKSAFKVIFPKVLIKSSRGRFISHSMFVSRSRNIDVYSSHLPARIIFVLIVLLTLLVSSDLVMAEENKAVRSVLQANGEFTKNLYQLLAKQPGNVFFSPISVHAILSLAYQGSAGKTKDAFTKVLHVSDVKVAADGYKDIMLRLNSVKDVTLLMANKVFLMESYKLKEAFDSVAREQFLSEVQLLDFAQSVDAAKSINSWVEGKTNNKIKDLIESADLTEETRLVLVNAIYFKGKWAEPFKPENTITEKFYLNDTETVDVQMMHIENKFFYKNDENLDAKVLELPYVNNAISLIVILPNKRNGIAELEQKLATTDLTKITENMYKPEVNVALPKFKIEQTIDLKQSLTELGLGDIFSRNANFSELVDSSEQLFVSKVVQKAFIEVNEEGAEAAAATGMIMAMRMAFIPQEPETFKADHPFTLYLVQRQGELIHQLFNGRVYKPQV